MNINEIVSAYILAKEAESKAKAEKEAMAKLIKDFAKENELFETEDYTVIMRHSVQNRLDQKALEKDFPDIKTVYSKPVETVTINPVRKASVNAA